MLSFDNKNDDCNDNDNNNLLYENDNNNDYRLNQRVCMFCVALGSCVLNAFAVKCQSTPSIDPLLTLVNILLNTESTLDRHLIDSQSIIG